jgi:hypothetical protein
MKPAIAITGVVLGFAAVWFWADAREAHQRLDRARLDHDALQVRIAVLQGQIDKRAEEDRIDEESRLQEQKAQEIEKQQLREQEDFKNRWQPTQKDLDAFQRMESDDLEVRHRQGLENSKMIEDSMRRLQKPHDAGL